MTSLIVASVVNWARMGNTQLKQNWSQGMAEHSGTSVTSILKQVYFGVCLGMLGLTGFECESCFFQKSKTQVLTPFSIRYTLLHLAD